MENTLAHQTNTTIDNYLMGELSHEERSAFEEHMFDCPECAAKVKQDYGMIADLKAVLAEPRRSEQVQRASKWGGWLEWFRPVSLAPAFAALGLAFMVGYQNLVSIPGMLQPQVLESTPMVATTRGSEPQVISVKPGSGMFLASFQVSSPTVHPAYVCEFNAEGRGLVTSASCGEHATAEFTLNVLLPVGKFPPGVYTMILRPVSDKRTEITRYQFAIRN